MAKLFFKPRSYIFKLKHQELYAFYALVSKLVDFFAGLSFVVGSMLFFWESQAYAATWMFLIGSVLFTIKPGIYVAREIHLMWKGQRNRVVSTGES